VATVDRIIYMSVILQHISTEKSSNTGHVRELWTVCSATRSLCDGTFAITYEVE